MNIQKEVDKLDAKIMDWHYSVCKINFGADTYIQDSSDLRDILEDTLETLNHKEEIQEILEKVLPKEKIANTKANYICGHAHSTEYENEGWNDCLKEINKAVDKYVK